MGDIPGATSSYRNAIATRPSHVEAHINLGAMLAAQGRSHEAIAMYERAVALAPQIPEAQAGLAHLYLQAGDRSRARVHAERALELQEGWGFATEILNRLDAADAP